ncbi:MAG: helix-turn-helix domain-containing protein [Candidatus Dormiibacterota bacterium]
MPHQVGLVVLPGAAIFELSFAVEVFGEDRPDLADPWYRLRIVATEPGPARLGGGFVLPHPEGLGALAEVDTVVVGAAHGTAAAFPDALLVALRAAYVRGARIAAICTGGFALAAAGLLDGRRAATHWMYADELRRRHPAIEVDANVIYVEDGGIFTSAGSAAGLDLCLHLVRLDHGARVANALARRLVVPPHREGGQAQYVERPVPPDGDDGLGPVLDWARANLERPLTVDQLARCAGMSVRTFARRFEAQVGTTPLQWLIGERGGAARELLESTDLPVELVADRCGFGTAASLRLHFQRLTGTSPLAYRRAFRYAAS